MTRALLIAFLTLLLAACSRGGERAPATQRIFKPLRNLTDTIRHAPLDERILYLPDRQRALTPSDGSANDMSWRPLGVTVPGLLNKVLYGLLLRDSRVVDREGNSTGASLPAAAHVAVRESGEWLSTGEDYRRLYRVRYEAGGKATEGWVDSASVALIIAEDSGLAVGIVPRKIVIAGGESEFSLLALVESNRVTVVDTSLFVFPDEFHPSGVVKVTLADVNSDSQPEIVLEAETIVSLRHLGASPLRWKAWLRRTDGVLTSIFLYDQSYGSDSGYAYTATERSFDSGSTGMRDMVRVDTDYILVAGENEFHTSTVAFYAWNGTEFRKAPLEDLPRLGTVTADSTPLRAQPVPEGEVRGHLAKGDQLYVFDRSDTRQNRNDPGSWWYKAITKSGAEGWISGTAVELSWVDPLKTNKETFLKKE